LFIFAHQFNWKVAGVVELVDTLDLGSSAARCESSSLSACTKENLNLFISKQLRFIALNNCTIFVRSTLFT
jgi:hypothetical protein